MPQVLNLSRSYVGVNPAVLSVRYWLFPGPPFDYPQPPAAVPTPEVEVAADQAHFVIFEGFDRRNAGGNTLGRGSIDTGAQTAMQAYGATTLEELLAGAFPDPATNP